MPGSFVATGNIAPCRFVKFDTAGPGKVAAAGAGEAIAGVSGQGTRYLPWSALDDGYHAISGENCQVYQDGSKRIMIELGGTVDEGDWLLASTNGVAVASSTDKDKVGGRARMAGTSGQLIEMDVIIGERSV